MVEMAKKWILPVCVVLCGVALSKSAFDQALTLRHLIWCAATIFIVLSSKTVKVNYFAVGYLVFVLLSGLFATNKSEWLYAALRAILFVAFLSTVKIDKKLLAKTMIALGVVFFCYFWYDHFTSTGHRGLMRMRNFWAAAHFFVIPFCLYAISKKFWRDISVIVIIAMVTNIFVANSRSAILAMIVPTIILSFSARKNIVSFAKRVTKFPAMPYVIITVTFCTFLSYPIWIHATKTLSGDLLSSASLSLRIAQWVPTVNMIRDNPAGVGAGNWWIVFPKYANGIDYPSAFESVTFRHPHNDYLWICAESGIGALICYIGLAMSCLYYAWKEKASWLFFGLTGYMVIAFFSASHERAFASIIFALFIAMSLKGKEVNHRNIMIPALILAMVVFGFRYRSSCWNKKLRITTSWQEVLDCCEGYSMFSSMTHTGLPYHWWSATANLHLGKKEIASDQFQTAYRYNPYNIHVINGYGVSLALQGDKAGAERQFAYSLSIWPDFEDAKLNLAKLGEMQ